MDECVDLDVFRSERLDPAAQASAELLVAVASSGDRATKEAAALDGANRMPPPAPSDLVLHLPEDRRERALVVGIPSDLTPAQRAAYDWLVQGRTSLRDAGRPDR